VEHVEKVDPDKSGKSMITVYVHWYGDFGPDEVVYADVLGLMGRSRFMIRRLFIECVLRRYV
jgi:hypothetical protein